LHIEYGNYSVAASSRVSRDGAFYSVFVFQNPESLIKLVVIIGIVGFSRAIPYLITIFIFNG